MLGSWKASDVSGLSRPLGICRDFPLIWGSSSNILSSHLELLHLLVSIVLVMFLGR